MSDDDGVIDAGHDTAAWERLCRSPAADRDIGCTRPAGHAGDLHVAHDYKNRPVWLWYTGGAVTTAREGLPERPEDTRSRHAAARKAAAERVLDLVRRIDEATAPVDDRCPRCGRPESEHRPVEWTRMAPTPEEDGYRAALRKIRALADRCMSGNPDDAANDLCAAGETAEGALRAGAPHGPDGG